MWVDSETLTDENAAERLKGAAGVLVPGGFGERGIEGMIAAARYCRENGIPYFGICLGMQIAVIEFARHQAGMTDANSREFDENSSHLVIDLMPDQKGNIPKGGTMRLGAYPCQIKEGTRLHDIYGKDLINERHRHRYEVNNQYRTALEEAGLVFCGLSPDGRLAEAIEIREHPFFIAVQYHPEFKSRPNHAQPIFREFVKACLERIGAC